jgi:alkylation response protein AidB-like acyl-CoA dehydrogenase
VTATAERTDERRALTMAVRDFADRTCGTRDQRLRLTDGGVEVHSPEVYGRLAEMGWVGAPVPSAYGGGDGTVVDACLLLEELEYGQVPVFGLGVTWIVAEAVRRFGTEQQRARVLQSVCAGAPRSISMSEPDAGSDVGSLRTTARAHPDGWVLNGQKTWTTTAQHAAELLVVCRTDSAAPKHRGLSMFLVPADAAGVTIRLIPTMAGREVNDVFLTDVVVPADALVGELDQGWGQLMAGLAFERLIGAAQMLGLARRAFDTTLSYVTQRRQFGRPVGSFQALKHRIADLATELECARLLIYDTAARVEADPHASFARESSMCKLKASELARRMALDGMQMMGGAGYATEFEMEHLVRKALPTTIYGGTSEIQREIIGSSYGL